MVVGWDAVEGEKSEPWKVKSQFRSGNYLTDISELLTIHICCLALRYLPTLEFL
ncbi:MAG: DUF4113 domain-containing protein [Bacteroidales bacterium]|nr:DUF4113 domain-containing protein [Candidatus Cacconaster caballi]